jgi:hypothetical protein
MFELDDLEDKPSRSTEPHARLDFMESVISDKSKSQYQKRQEITKIYS